MAAVLSTKYPNKAPELWAYQSSILRAVKNYEGLTYVKKEQMVKPFRLHCHPQVCFQSFHGTKGMLAHCIRGGKEQDQLEKSDSFSNENTLIF